MGMGSAGGQRTEAAVGWYGQAKSNQISRISNEKTSQKQQIAYLLLISSCQIVAVATAGFVGNRRVEVGVVGYAQGESNRFRDLTVTEIMH